MTLAAAIARLQVHGKACTGVKYAPTAPSYGIAVYPFVVSYPGNGVLSGEAYDQTRDIHNIYTEIHGAPATTPSLAIQTVTPLIEEMGRKLALDPTLGGAVSNIVFPVSYEFVFSEWAGVQNCGIRFTVPVKIRGQAST